jgi:hypothetical protein
MLPAATTLVGRVAVIAARNGRSCIPNSARYETHGPFTNGAVSHYRRR